MTVTEVEPGRVRIDYRARSRGVERARSFVVAAGDLVRVDGWRGVFRVHGLRADGTVDLWGGDAGRFGMRTGHPERLRPPKRGDVAPSYPSSFSAPNRKAGRR